MDKPDQQRDFFVSYTQADRAWAEWMAWELEAAGYTTMLQAWDMPAGTAFVHAMDQAVQTTRHVVLVLSPAYLRSEMSEAEWRPGFKADPSGIQRRLLPVRVEECEPAGLLADRVWIDLVGTDEATARTRLREEIARALRGPGRPTTTPRFPRAPTGAVDRPRFPTALPPVWNVPFYRNPAFTGRDVELTALAAALKPGGTAAVTQVLQGGGGVGKTALAVEYAYRQRARFDTVWWVRAQEPATLVGDYAELAVTLGKIQAGQADQQNAASAVRRWLVDHDRWLLLFDNAGAPDALTGLEAPLDTVAGLLPQVVHGQVLITSRDARWEQHATLAELEVFTPDEAVAFLLVRSGSGDQATATEVAELLGCLPLALEQAGAYLRETRIPLSAYLDRLRQFPTLTLARGRPRHRDPADTVATTWQVSLEQVRPIPGAEALLEVCAFLGPEEIPRELFALPLDPPAEELAVLTDNPFALDEAVAAVRRYGLVKASQRTLVMHRLVQQIIRDQLDPATRAARATIALRLIRVAFPTEHTDPDAWPAHAWLLPHVLAVTSHADVSTIEPEAAAWLLTEAGLYLWQRADYQQARSLLERALAIDEAHLGAADPTTASVLNNLANVLDAQGDLPAARTLLERALAIDKAHLGADHPNTARSLNNLANVLADQGDLERARTMFERALAIREARLGADHPDTAHSLHNLADVLHARGDLEGARTLHERSLAVYEARLGADHTDTAHSRHGLAVILHAQGHLDQARTLHQRALATYEARRGADHTDTARSLNNLALVLRDQDDPDAARGLHLRALAIREARLGADHPHTAESLQNLADVLADQGDLDQARTLHERALAVREARLGADHPATVRSRERLAAVVAALDSER